MVDYDARTALVVVDVQNDFAHPDGSLYVHEAGDAIVAVNEEIAGARAAGALVAYTQDWHPEHTPHFAQDGGVWPVHCVGGAWGARFHDDLTALDGAPCVRKGAGSEDGYSGLLLDENDFEPLGDWLEFAHNDIRDIAPPEIPAGLTMRRGNADDHEAVIALEGAAYGDFTDGATATRSRLQAAAWLGVLERDGRIIGYAFNGPVEANRGEVISCAVQPSEQNRSIGKVILGAATYQLASAGARTASVRVWPEIPRGARIAQAVGYRVGNRGVELRRDSDEAVLAEHREEQRIRNMRVRFGNWR